MTETLCIKNLHVAVEGKRILNGVNLTIRRGETHALMGPNGSGKSTLAGVIMGHPSYEVTDGTIELNGENILEWDEHSTARTLANILAVAPAGARVVVVENLVDDGEVLGFTTAMDLLLMLNVGGRKHTEAGLVSLIRRGGLEVDRVRPLTPALHLIEARVPR